jgi:hypothetical protein
MALKESCNKQWHYRTNEHFQLPQLLYFMPEKKKDITVKISEFIHITGIINRTLKSSQVQ